MDGVRRYLDQCVHMLSCEAEAVKVEMGEGWPVGHNLQKALFCHPTALAHLQPLQPCHRPQSLCSMCCACLVYFRIPTISKVDLILSGFPTTLFENH